MFLIRILLFPFALLYDAVTGFRNRLYDLKLKPSVGFDIPVICVGNLSVGGTGKTPVVEYLIGLLGEKYSIAVLSRGYKRKTNGFRMAAPEDTASTLGDEPFQLYRKYGSRVSVAVGEDRAMAIPSIVQAQGNVDIILMDDGFQHRRVTPGFLILLTDYNKPFYQDFLLPAGRLRESRSNADRANVIIVTKCPPDIPEQSMEHIENEIGRYSQKPVFFAAIQYGQLTPFGNRGFETGDKVLLVTGIANPTPLLSFVTAHYTLVDHLDFPDHYHFTHKDLEKIKGYHDKDQSIIILTTEKDMVKLNSPGFENFIAALPFFYLPIEVGFVKGGKEFDKLVLQSVLRGDEG